MTILVVFNVFCTYAGLHKMRITYTTKQLILLPGVPLGIYQKRQLFLKTRLAVRGRNLHLGAIILH
jgi:hypothetical protein